MTDLTDDTKEDGCGGSELNAELGRVQKATYILAKSCNGCPVMTTLVIMLFYVMFNVFEASVEVLFFGKRFEHILDLLFQLAAIAYSAYAVYWCAIFNSNK